jgi:hypothetical protein
MSDGSDTEQIGFSDSESLAEEWRSADKSPKKVLVEMPSHLLQTQIDRDAERSVPSMVDSTSCSFVKNLGNLKVRSYDEVSELSAAAAARKVVSEEMKQPGNNDNENSSDASWSEVVNNHRDDIKTSHNRSTCSTSNAYNSD